MKEVSIWEKSNLTLEEAAAYSGIGINKLREISNDERCPFVLWVGSKRLTKRKDFDRYIEQTYPFNTPLKRNQPEENSLPAGIYIFSFTR